MIWFVVACPPSAYLKVCSRDLYIFSGPDISHATEAFIGELQAYESWVCSCQEARGPLRDSLLKDPYTGYIMDTRDGIELRQGACWST